MTARAGGDFAALYRGFFKNPDVQALSDRAFRVLTTLKGLLPLAGIGEVYGWELGQCCGCSAGEADAALAELEAPKPSGELGWIRREGRVVWLVNGLAHAPGVSARNRNHRAHVASTIGKVERLAPGLAEAFAARYPDYFTDTTPKGGIPWPCHGDQGDGEEEGSREKADRPPASAAPVDRFLSRHYAGAPPARVADVRRQLQQALSPAGCVVRRSPREVARATEASLERAVAECEVPGAVTVPDRAIVVLLRKLVHGRCNELAPAGSEWARDQAAAAQKPQPMGDHRPPVPIPPRPIVLADGERDLAFLWLDRHADVRERLEREADAFCANLHPRWQQMTWVLGVRARHLEEQAVRAFRAARPAVEVSS